MSAWGLEGGPKVAGAAQEPPGERLELEALVLEPAGLVLELEGLALRELEEPALARTLAEEPPHTRGDP